jgi:ferredoxin-type protein NapH
MKQIRSSTLRTLSILCFFAVTLAGLAFKTGGGTLSAFGYQSIAAICPLGSIEAMLASRSLLPRTLISLAVLIGITVFLGRIFCAWICPTPLLRSWFLGSAKSKRSNECTDIGEVDTFEPSERRIFCGVSVDSRHAVLGGALLSTALFGFPVFCLVCPIGLTFATIIGLWRLLLHNEPTWSLLLFPALLVLELVVLRKWCRKICPLGALLSLLSSMNRFVLPAIDRGVCLSTAKGVNCKLCKDACFEEINLHDMKASQPLAECTKCRACSDACPVNAITFPIFKRKDAAHEKQDS